MVDGHSEAVFGLKYDKHNNKPQNKMVINLFWTNFKVAATEKLKHGYFLFLCGAFLSATNT